jgi:hypothetical protein
MVLCVLLSFLGLGAACGRFGYDSSDPGINGTVRLGQEILIEQSRQIIVSIFSAEDFNPTQGRPKVGAIPLKSIEIRGLTSPPYLYDLKTANLRGTVYLFAVLDKNDTGSPLPDRGDAYGSYSQPLVLQGFRMPIDILVDKILE